MPSIMTGINQTILMCLSMVVIASLIGAGGLGANILEALQYAAKGQGMLAGPPWSSTASSKACTGAAWTGDLLETLTGCLGSFLGFGVSGGVVGH